MNSKQIRDAITEYVRPITGDRDFSCHFTYLVPAIKMTGEQSVIVHNEVSSGFGSNIFLLMAIDRIFGDNPGKLFRHALLVFGDLVIVIYQNRDGNITVNVDGPDRSGRILVPSVSTGN